jgi:cation diffusion facilitator CzcD-associated flavoprotein CzcO
MRVQFSREIPVNTDYDVIVAGGGPAGCAAAAAAARNGAKTLLLEATSTLGGMGTIGLVPRFCPFSDQEKIIYRGIAESAPERSALTPGIYHLTSTRPTLFPFLKR